MKRIILLFTFIALMSNLFAQNEEKFDSNFVFKFIRNKPDTIKAIFDWVADNIEYDIEMFHSSKFTSEELILDEVWRNKKGVCSHYAKLFNAFCRKANIESYEIHGYVKKDGKLSELGHAWNVIKKDGKWLCYDPTWAAGYVEDSIFIKEFNVDWYARIPEEFAYTHIPIETAWQLRDYPLSIEEAISFQKSSATSRYFYEDTLKIILNLNDLDAKVRTIKNYESFVKNTTTLEAEVLNMKNHIFLLYYNNAVNAQNKLLEGYKLRFAKRNKWSEEDIVKYQTLMNNAYENAIKYKIQIEGKNITYQPNIDNFEKAKNQANNINIFLNKYFSKKKMWRELVFYNPKNWIRD